MDIYRKIINDQLSVELINELTNSAIYCDMLNCHLSMHSKLYDFCYNNDMIKEFVAIVKFYKITDVNFVVKLIDELPIVNLYLFIGTLGSFSDKEKKQILIAVIKRNNFSIGLKVSSHFFDYDTYNSVSYGDIMNDILSLDLYQYEDGIISLCMSTLLHKENYEISDYMKRVSTKIPYEKIKQARKRDSVENIMKYSNIRKEYYDYVFSCSESEYETEDLIFINVNRESNTISFNNETMSINEFITKMVKYENYSFLKLKINDDYISVKEKELIRNSYNYSWTVDIPTFSLNREKINYLLPNYYSVNYMIKHIDTPLLYDCLLNYGFDIYDLIEKEYDLNQIMANYAAFLKN